MSKFKNLGLSDNDIWDIADYIVTKQNKSELIPSEIKEQIYWQTLLDDWFDTLEEIIKEKPPITMTAKELQNK